MPPWRDTEISAHAETRAREDAAGRWPSVSPGGSRQQRALLPLGPAAPRAVSQWMVLLAPPACAVCHAALADPEAPGLQPAPRPRFHRSLGPAGGTEELLFSRNQWARPPGANPVSEPRGAVQHGTPLCCPRSCSPATQVG